MTAAWDGSHTALTFTGITLGTTKWKAADSYLTLNASMTDGTGGIQIYTNNVHNTSPYIYTGSTVSQSCAGLVDSADTTQVLPMCWRIVQVSTTSLSIVQYSTSTTAIPIYLGAQELGSKDCENRTYQAGIDFRCFLWMLDRSSSGFGGDGSSYITVMNAANGIQYCENGWGQVGNSAVIYLGADFSKAMTSSSGTAYGTTTLTVESYHQ
jgi:hypothetical protein